MISPAPDYADPRCWFPQAKDTATSLATVFYVHPTTYPGELWNQELAHPPLHDATTSEIVRRQTAPFAASCRIFAPRYRQASSRAFRDSGTGSETAYALAYADVRAAFEHYLRHWHRGRLILLGHSQGALHLGRLLAQEIEPRGLVPDLVAAYLIGIGFSEGLFGRRFHTIAPCERPDQTQCLISWNTFLAGGDPSPFRKRTRERDAAVLDGAPPGNPICINPVSFDARFPDMPGVRVQGGVVWVEAAPADMPPLPGGNMHMHDIALFEDTLGKNAKRRLSSSFEPEHARP